MAGAQVTLLSRIAAFESFGIPSFSGGGITVYPAGFACTSYMQHPYGQGDIAWQGAEFGLSAPNGSNVTRAAVTVTFRVSDPAAFSAVTLQLYANSAPIGSPEVVTPSGATNVTQTLTYRGGMTPAHLSTLAVQVSFHQVQTGLAYVISAYAEADYSFASSVGIITVPGGPASVASLAPYVSPPARAALVSQGAVGGFSPSFGQPTALGDLLLAWTLCNSASATFDTTCDDPSWTLIGSSGASFGWRGLWYKPRCAASEAPPVFTSAGSFGEAQLLEFSGVTTLDQSGTQFNAGNQDFTVSESAPDTTSGDFIAAIMIWTGGGATTPVTSAVSGTDSSGAPLALTTYTNDLTTGQSPYAFSWAQAGAPAGPGVTSMTASLSAFGESGAILATFHAAASVPVPPPPYAIWPGPVNRAVTIPIRAGR